MINEIMKVRRVFCLLVFAFQAMRYGWVGWHGRDGESVGWVHSVGY